MKRLIWITIFLVTIFFTYELGRGGYRLYKHKPLIKTLDTVTVYHPTTQQCDSDPLVTASLDTIDINNLPTNWLALSRDLLLQGFTYNDEVYVCFPDSIVKMVVKDTMNKRYKNNR